MNPDYANILFQEGGTLVIMGMPPSTEFGIDLNTWNVGHKFKGLKMIPPGLHFIYYSAVSKELDTGPRTGFFYFFKRGEIVVYNYDPIHEELEPEVDKDQQERVSRNIRSIDCELGAYPFDSWEKWVSLSEFITEDELKRMQPISGKISSVPELLPVNKKYQKSAVDSRMKRRKMMMPVIPENSGSDAASGSENSSKSGSGLPEMVLRPGSEIRFSEIPKYQFREGAEPSEITKYSLDSSYCLQKILDKLPRLECILSELQLAFVCFLVGQVWYAWEHWRTLVLMVCKAEETLISNPQLYLQLISVLHFQIQEVPEDLFVDIVENNNFLAIALSVFFANVHDSAISLPHELVTKARKFKKHLQKKFKWNLTLGEGEDAPVIVELG